MDPLQQYRRLQEPHSDLFESEEPCVATLVAWADGGIRMPRPFSKSNHKRYEPPVEEVALVLPTIVSGDGD